MTDHYFEMRRLEALSNTIFGVAMTLLSFQIPRDLLGANVPNFGNIWHAYEAQLFALVLSFTVAGMFWFSQQRRLAYASHGNRLAVLVNLLFLMSVILLPVTSGLYGTYSNVADVTALFGFHLTLISALNVVLWLIAVAPRRHWSMVGGPAFTTLIFLFASIVALPAPDLTKFVLSLAFISPVVSALFERRGA
jgi:uncharacterized membrane protein